MTSLRIAFTELERILSGRMPKLAVLALALIPTLYGGLYLYANHDPYENLDRVPALIVLRPKRLSGGTATATVSYGFRDTQSIRQEIVDALYDGRSVGYSPD